MAEMKTAIPVRPLRTPVLVACAAQLVVEGCTGSLFSSPRPPPAPDRTEVHVGVAASARSDSGPGNGWLLAVGVRGAENGWLFGGVSFLGELSRLEQEDGTHTTRFVLGVDDRKDLLDLGGTGALGIGWGGGYALSIGDDGLWAGGMQFHAGIGPRWERAELRLGTAVYLWAGERDDEFDVDAEADVRLIAGVRF